MDVDGHDLSLTKTSVKGIVKDETGDRVSGDAILYIMMLEEERIRQIADAAQKVKDQSGRATIQEGDVRAAVQIMGMGP